MGGNIPGGNSPGGSLMAGSFPGGIFPEPIFISTMKTSYLPHKNTVSKDEILNQSKLRFFSQIYGQNCFVKFLNHSINLKTTLRKSYKDTKQANFYQ